MLKNGEGGFVADEHTLDRLEGEGRVVARYLDDNPNGSLRDIAGITNERGNVVGLMPHPEHAVEDLTGPGTDGLGFFTSLRRSGSLATGPSRRELPGPGGCEAVRLTRADSWGEGEQAVLPLPLLAACSCFQLRGAMTPVTGSPACCCQVRTAASVVASNTPVTARRGRARPR